MRLAQAAEAHFLLGGSKIMAQVRPHVVQTPDPGPTADVGCCWPECDSPAAVTNLPICLDHALTVYGAVLDVKRSRFDEIADATEPLTTRHDGLVYFLRFADRIKIGFTCNLTQRLTTIPHDEVLLTMPGTMRDEKRCHAAFAHLREIGEWFRIEDDLLAFIEDLRVQAA